MSIVYKAKWTNKDVCHSFVNDVSNFFAELDNSLQILEEYLLSFWAVCSVIVIGTTLFYIYSALVMCSSVFSQSRQSCK